MGHKQHDILSRLSKDAVRNHRNVRLAGEGGVPAAEGTAAHNYGMQTQQNIQSHLQGYANQIPGVHQAQGVYNTMHNFGGGGGGRREMPGEGPLGDGYLPPPGPPSGYGGRPPSTNTGSASEYFTSEQASHPPSGTPFGGGGGNMAMPGNDYAPGGGVLPSFPGISSGYASPPPSFPSAGPPMGGYNPPPGVPPQFPGQGPLYGVGPSQYYAPPPNPPPNQGGYNPGYNYGGGTPQGGW